MPNRPTCHPPLPYRGPQLLSGCLHEQRVQAWRRGSQRGAQAPQGPGRSPPCAPLGNETRTEADWLLHGEQGTNATRKMAMICCCGLNFVCGGLWLAGEVAFDVFSVGGSM